LLIARLSFLCCGLYFLSMEFKVLGLQFVIGEPGGQHSRYANSERTTESTSNIELLSSKWVLGDPGMLRFTLLFRLCG